MDKLKKKIIEKQILSLEDELKYWKSAKDIKTDKNVSTVLLMSEPDKIPVESVLVETPSFADDNGNIHIFDKNFIIKNENIKDFD